MVAVEPNTVTDIATRVGHVDPLALRRAVEPRVLVDNAVALLLGPQASELAGPADRAGSLE